MLRGGETQTGYRMPIVKSTLDLLGALFLVRCIETVDFPIIFSMDSSKISKKILIIDDDETLTQALSERLTEAGHEVLSATDGQAGLDVALKTHPDLVVLDVAMPVMDGWDVLTAIRTDGWGKDARVVMLTNSDDMENVSQAIERGSTEYLIKGSWTLDDIVAKVDQMLS